MKNEELKKSKLSSRPHRSIASGKNLYLVGKTQPSIVTMHQIGQRDPPRK